MKKYFLLLFSNCALCIVHCAFAQNPLVKQWDARFGGKQNDELFSFQQTADRGYILGGYSLSGISGNKTQPSQGGMDYWIVKTDGSGILEWEATFGGSDDDILTSLFQTSDHGYILGGYSLSPAGGDKSQPTQGGNDYWIIKLDSLGNKIWDKDFGGSADDNLWSICQTSDRGYILGGSSVSQAGGDKTQNTWAGSADYWIIKTDSNGTQLWDKDLGGTANDELRTVTETHDGGYFLAGFSVSGAGGDKSQASFGITDYWIIKTNALGNLIWDASFGGTDADGLFASEQTADNGYIIGGYSSSGIGGNKTTPLWGLSSNDYWVLKVDSTGNKQWERDFGGNVNEDEFGSVFQTFDGGYLFAGTSYSDISGDKSENNYLGAEQTWIIKTDSVGNKQWDKTIFTTGHDETGYAIQTDDGCYAIANWDNGGIGGYRTQDNWDTLISVSTAGDYWIVKFCDSTLVAQASFTASNHICPGTCIDFTNLSVNANSYQWLFPGATPSVSIDINPQGVCYASPGSYDVTLIASGSGGSDTLTLANFITVYPNPPPQAITQGGDTLFANTGASTYQWYFNGNIITGATVYFYVAQASGDYNVVATDVNGCEVEAAVFNIIAAVGSSSRQELNIFPNPVIDKCTIHDSELTMGIAVEISVYNVIGERKINLDIEQNIIDCRVLPSGLYFLELKTGDQIKRTRFIKQ